MGSVCVLLSAALQRPNQENRCQPGTGLVQRALRSLQRAQSRIKGHPCLRLLNCWGSREQARGSTEGGQAHQGWLAWAIRAWVEQHHHYLQRSYSGENCG